MAHSHMNRDPLVSGFGGMDEDLEIRGLSSSKKEQRRERR